MVFKIKAASFSVFFTLILFIQSGYAYFVNTIEIGKLVTGFATGFLRIRNSVVSKQ